MFATTIQTQTDQQIFRFDHVSWQFFQAVLAENPDRKTRIAYDGETLEMMTSSQEHERYSTFLQSIVCELSVAFDFAVVSGGSVTLVREDLQKGLEPDKCFWIDHSDAVINKKRISLDVDPPPDLVIEIDVTHAAVNRSSIYAAMGVREMWQCRLGRLKSFALVDGSWEPTELSVSFPAVKVDELNRFLSRLWDENETVIVRDVRKWAESLSRR